MLGPQDTPAEEEVIKLKDPTTPPEEKPEDLGIPQDGELERLALARSLGLENLRDISRYHNQLDRIVEWAKAKGAVSREDVVWQVRQLMTRVGGPSLGNNWAQHLSQYAYLEMERMKLDGQLKEFEAHA